MDVFSRPAETDSYAGTGILAGDVINLQLLYCITMKLHLKHFNLLLSKIAFCHFSANKIIFEDELSNDI